MHGIVFNIQHFSVHDGPGIRTTVFLKGCPLRCAWCHNAEGLEPGRELFFAAERCTGCGNCVKACPRGAVRMENAKAVTDRARCTACGACVKMCLGDARSVCGEELSVEQVMCELRKDLVFYRQSGGGVTLSGGEPLMQPEFAAALLKACRAEGIHTVLDTCGQAPWDSFAAVLPDVKLFLFDLKAWTEAAHRRGTGVGNRLILKNLERLCAAGAQVRVRVPLVPGLTDAPEELSGIAGFLAELPVEQVNLLPFHQSGRAKYGRLGHGYALADSAALDRAAAEKYRCFFDKLKCPVCVGG